MAKGLNDIIREFDNYSGNEEVKMASVNILNPEMNSSEQIEKFAQLLVKTASEIDKENFIEKEYQLNPVEKIAEHILISNLIQKKIAEK